MPESMPESQANIGLRGQRRRLFLGVPLVLIGVIASFVTRSFLAQVVAFFGFLSMYQALDKT